MRIGIDMTGWQIPSARGRGIGRYTQEFIAALTDGDSANEYILYFFDRFDCWDKKCGPGAKLRVVWSGNRFLRDVVQGLVDRNPDDVDLFLVTSPFSSEEGYCTPAKPVSRLRLASVLYDLIPLLFEDSYLNGDLSFRADYLERLGRMQSYDLLLAISDATLKDAVIH